MAYVLTARAGLALAEGHESATAVWAPSGLALAALLLWGLRLWPAVFLGALVANLFTDAPLGSVAGIATGNTLEALVGAWLISRVPDFRPALDRVRAVVALALLGGGVSTLVSATVGVASLYAGGAIEGSDLASAWQVWWLGDMGGDLIVAPALLVLGSCGFSPPDRRRAVGFVSLMACLAVIGVLGLSSEESFAFLLFPLVFWISLRFRQAGAVTSSLLLSALAVWFTAQDQGPFATGTPDADLLRAQLFVGFTALTALLAAAVHVERQRAEKELLDIEAANEELARSEERSRLMMEATHDSFVSFDAAGLITDWNRQAETTFGWSRAEAIGRSLTDTIIPEHHREAHARAVERFLATEEPQVLGQHVELAACRRDGHELSVEMTISAVKAGGDYSFTAFIHDISDRTQRERYFAAEHAVTRVLLESATVAEARPGVLEAVGESLGCALAGWWETDPATGALRCEATWHSATFDADPVPDLTARPRLGAGTDGIWDGRKPRLIEDLARDSRFEQLRADSELTCAIELPLVSDNEALAVIELCSVHPLRLGDEPVDAMTALCERLVRHLERDRAAQALSEANERFATAFGSAPNGMAVISADRDHLGDFVQVNDALCELTGYTRQQLLRCGFRDITHPDDLAAVLSDTRRLLRGEITQHQTEKRYVRANGEIVWLLLTASLVRDAEGEPLYFISQTVDMTDRKRAERELALQGEIAGNMTEGVCLVRVSDGGIAWVNESWNEMFGYSDDEPIGKSIAVVNASVDLAPKETARTIMDVLRRDGAWSGEVENIRKDGSRLRCEVHISTFEDPEYGSVWVAVHTDVTARRVAELELREAEERFRRAFEDAATGMAILGVGGELEGRFLEANDALCKITGYTREELLATGFGDVTHPEDRETAADGDRTLMAGKAASYQREQRIVDAAGEVVWVYVSSSVVRDGDGRPLHRIAQLQEITERKRFEDQLQYLADHDQVTGLFNRRRFDEELARELASARRYGTGGAVLALDLDNFKYVNDTLGHVAGDRLIAKVADVLRRRLSDSDILARLGGDEFAVILPYADEEKARVVASELIDAVRGEAMVTIDRGSRRTTVSVGIALFFETPNQLDSDELLVEADIALYDAKDSGRDRVCVFDPASGRQAGMEDRLNWVEQIREALEEQRFVLHAQPIVPLQGAGPLRHELLVRMVGKSGELIPPSAFLAHAERSGLIQELDRWVVGRAISLLASERYGADDVCFEVNLSARSIIDPELVTVIAAELAGSGVHPRQLIFEVTETEAILNLDRAKVFAHRIRELGCGFALDDFGRGFASFWSLKQLPFDNLKIDGAFIEGLAGDTANQVFVEAVVKLARLSGTKTIAEYVGDEETFELLRSYGVDYAQGFYLGKPTPLEAAEARSAAELVRAEASQATVSVG